MKNIFSKQVQTLKNDLGDHFGAEARGCGSHWNLQTSSMPIFRGVTSRSKFLCSLIFMGLLTTACDDFVDVELPNNQLTSQAVFEDAATATAALRSIYTKMNFEGVLPRLSRSLGLYADELENFRSSENPFYEHTLTELNGTISSWWRSTYNLIYAANAIIEGVENATALSLEDTNQIKGEALFIRAYLHHVLVDLWGDIPYISTTDYIANTTVARTSVDAVYNNIISDLLEASTLLGEDISEAGEERIRPYKAVAEALLARVYLYSENWEAAEDSADNIIDGFVLEPDLNKVFLKDASGTIWQFKPILDGENTQDAISFIFEGRPTDVALSSSILEAFETDDLRASSWIESTIVDEDTSYYAFKYKALNTTFLADGETANSEEYPVVFRLAEQYLIRAEARAELGKISEAQSDLNVIRNRAGLG
ncbi:RagB/SusD family nutrient uptake outer membrane protein, partial [Flavivirga aquimarina]